ncbi:MAG TPA: TIGR02996 domain-containing protein [Kofleriaceae bacterium]
MIPAELVAAIQASPDEPDAYLVAADYLQQRGDPHGELIALSIALDRDPDLAKRVDELQDLIDPFAALEHRRWPHDWRWGFIRRGLASLEVPAIARGLLRAPAAQCLRELLIGGRGPESIHPTLEVVIDHAPTLQALRSLVLPRWSVYPAVQPHWPVFPALERLVIGAAQLPVESVFPALRELVIGLGAEQDVWLDRAPLPEVESLVLHTDKPLLDPLRFLAPVPRLRRLTVVGHAGTLDQAGIEALASRVDEVDVLTTDPLEARGVPTFRRFATRAPYAPGEAALLAVGGSDPIEPGTLHPLRDGEVFVVGRSTTSHLVVGPACGRRHATIERARGVDRWTVTHLGTGAYTIVCGTRTDGIALRDGDELQLGSHIFRFLEHDVAAKAAALSRQLALPARNAPLRMSR